MKGLQVGLVGVALRALALGSAGRTGRRARHIRLANALALVEATFALASLPFDLLAGPLWFLWFDLAALLGSAGCLALNRSGRDEAGRVVLILVGNAVFLCSSLVLGRSSDQQLLFFALATVPFFVFELREWHLLVPLVALSVVAYGLALLLPYFGPSPVFSVRAYRVYSALLTFAALIASANAFARANEHAERVLEQRQRELDDAHARSIAAARMAALGEMSSGIAHEIRNPLNTVVLVGDQLARADALPKAADRLNRAAARITKILDALALFARDPNSDPMISCDVGAVVEETVALCHQRFNRDQVRLELARFPPITMECRASHLSQVLLTLLSNAHDAALEGADLTQGRWVRLECSVADEAAVIAITDSGPGVPEPIRDHIFEPFFTTKRTGAGAGLGLSVARGIVEMHHGTLTLDASSAHTRFVVRCPLRQPREDASQPRSRSKTRGLLSKSR